MRCPRCRRWRRRGRSASSCVGGQAERGQELAAESLAGDERSVVHDVAGTTVDPVDSLIEMDGKIWRFVDTAGLRRKVGRPADTSSMHPYAPMARSTAAEVVIVLIDGSQPLTEQDQRVLTMVIDSPAGRSCWLPTNGTSSTRTGRYGPRPARSNANSRRCSGSPGVNISAKTGGAVQSWCRTGDSVGVLGQPDLDRAG
jgi:GTP-binding protein